MSEDNSSRSEDNSPAATFHFDEADQVAQLYDQVRWDPAAGDQVKLAGRVWIGVDPGAPEGDVTGYWVSYVDADGRRRHRVATAEEEAALLAASQSDLAPWQCDVLRGLKKPPSTMIASLPARRMGKSYLAQIARGDLDLVSFRELYFGTFQPERWPTLQQLVALERIRDYQQARGRLALPAIGAERLDKLYDQGWIEPPANGRLWVVLTKKGREILYRCEKLDRRSFQDEDAGGEGG